MTKYKDIGIQCTCCDYTTHFFTLDSQYDAMCDECGASVHRGGEPLIPPPPTGIDPVTRKPPGKTPFSLVHFPFVAAMAKGLARGIKNGRAADDWKHMGWTADTRRQYVDALYRHALEELDPVAVALNCMIIWYHDNKRRIAAETEEK